MAINFLAMPALQDPGGYNFKPLADGFDAIREGKKDNRLLDIKQQAQDLDKSRFGLQERQFGAQEQQRKAELLANQAMAVDQLQGPARAAAYQRVLAAHPDAANLPEQYRDPMNGPKLIAADYGRFRDQQAEALKQAQIAETNAGATLKTAQAQKAGREAEGLLTEYGKAGTIVQAPDGKYYSVQFAANGTRKILPIEADGAQPGASRIPLAPARGVQTVDEGTGTRIIDKSTGQDVRSIPKNIAEREAQEEVGKKKGQFEANITKAELALKDLQGSAKTVDQTIDDTIAHIRKYGRYAAGIGSATRNIPESPAFELVRKMNTVKANIGFDKLQAMRDASPTGGALGNVSDQENVLLQSVQGSFDTGRDPQDIITDLLKLKEARKKTLEDRIEALAKDRARFMETTPRQPTATGARAQEADGWITLGNGIRIREKK